MSKHLARDLETLDKSVLQQSSMVEEMITKACRALREKRRDLAESLMKIEPVINAREVEIEESCLKILALHQPVARDLRRTATVLKINADLERIADLAVNIGERAIALSKYPNSIVPDHLEQMAEIASQMVRDALDSFVAQDVEMAREVCLRDDQVDQLNREVIYAMIHVMEKNSELVEVSLHYFSAARHIERIADHATNIAEDVLYLVDGDIARHQMEEPQPMPRNK